jgi:alpha-methylacyl-CoA racemase
VLGAVESKFWLDFCNAAGRPDWIGRQTEALPQHALIAEVAAFFADLPLAECEARFAAADCCLSPVLDLAEALHAPHHQARGVVRAGDDGGLQALFPALVDGRPPAARAGMIHAAHAAGCGINKILWE